MKLNSISIGGGLALVAVGLLANAAASLVGSPDRTANADDLKRAAKNPQPIADVAVSRADEGGAEMVAMGDGGGCIWGEPLDWFGDIHELPDCAMGSPYELAFVMMRGGMVDINRDGNQEAVEIISPASNWVLIEKNQTFYEECGVWTDDWVVLGGASVLLRRCVLSRDSVIEYAQSQTPFALAYLYLYGGGWRDMDGDGDLDYAFILHGSDGASYLTKAFWLENTGYEATQPLVGDLDGDGSVGASDLTMLLGGWTGN